VLGGQDMSLKQILDEVARLVGRTPPRVRLPHAAVMPIAYLAEGFTRVFGGSTRITVESVRMSRKLMFFSSAKAQRELGYHWRVPTAALADAVRWFEERGLI
jgi:dihydroflavonol-4-reductase